MVTREISNHDDVIDIRDVIARVEELQDDAFATGGNIAEIGSELCQLTPLIALLEECKGNGGDEQWRGDWYPGLLVRDSYFRTYAQELADDIGAISADATWPCNCIDWDQAARELRMDYTAVEFNGVTYWAR